MERIQVDIVGLSTSPASGGSYALILKEVHGNRRLPIIIGAFEAQSIALEIEGIKPPRPLTHDLMKNIVDSLGYSVTEVVINDLRDGTFYARLFLDAGGEQEIDSRPSDAIALAVRYRVPIYVMSEVMDEAGFVPEEEEELPDEPAYTPEPQTTEEKIADLERKLQEAISREDYELAARLRDEIRNLKDGG
ncbi:MAG: bifunctional nuclease family protein [Chlorobi bacterium]|nr:bifunctional nuclease family protein [Chlorobiota bacterium]